MTRLSLLVIIVLAVIIGGICIASANNKLPSIIDIVDSIQGTLNSSKSDPGQLADALPTRTSSPNRRGSSPLRESEFAPGFASEALLIANSDMLTGIMASHPSQGDTSHVPSFGFNSLQGNSSSASDGHSGLVSQYSGALSGAGGSVLFSGVSSVSGGSSTPEGSGGSGSNPAYIQPLSLTPFLQSPSSTQPQTDPASGTGDKPASSPFLSAPPVSAFASPLELFGQDLPSEREGSDGGDLVATPEPGTMILGGLGLAGLAAAKRRKGLQR